MMFVCVVMLTSLVGCGSQTSTTTPTTAVPSIVDSDAVEVTASTMHYDGKQKQVGSGPDSVTSTLSISKDGTIVAVKNVFVQGYLMSKNFQSAFSGAIAEEIVGKNIKDAKVTVVAGASMTSTAFNMALDEIRTKVN